MEHSRALARVGLRLHRPVGVLTTAIVVALALGVGVVTTTIVTSSPVAAQTDNDAAERAAREILAARDRANDAAEAFFQAESDIEVLEDEAVRLELEIERLEVAVEDLQRDVESLAIARFVDSGSSGIPLLTNLDEPQDKVQADVLADVVTNTSADILDQYEAAAEELDDSKGALAEQRTEIEQQQVTLDINTENGGSSELLNAIREPRTLP
jgi:septal ring factor EnvC (AmiA/AmiB activator)